MGYFLDFGSKVCPTFLFQGFQPGRRLVGQIQVQLVQEQFNVFFGLGVAGQDQVASIGGRQMDVDHLYGLELFEDGAGRQAGGFGLGPLFEGHLQAVAQEAHKDVRFDPAVFPVVDRPDVQVVLELFEGLLDFGEDDVLFP